VTALRQAITSVDAEPAILSWIHDWLDTLLICSVPAV
jgi:hypothetical protein